MATIGRGKVVGDVIAMMVLTPLVFAGVTAGLLAGYLRFLRTSLLDEEAQLATAHAR